MVVNIKQLVASTLILVFGLGLGLASVAHAEEQLEVRVVSTGINPFIHVGDDGSVTGPWVPLISDYLNKAGLSHNFHIMPWSRALQSARSTPNTLIVNLDRTKERENEFAWLLKLNSYSYHLIANKNTPFANMNLQQAIASGERAICTTATTSCKILRNSGFPENQIWAIHDFSGSAIIKLLLAERAAFWLAPLDVHLAALPTMDPIRGQLVPVVELLGVSSYLAISQSADPRILEKLRAAHGEFGEPQD